MNMLGEPEFFRQHESELRGLSRGFVGLEVEPVERSSPERSADPAERPLANRPPPPLGVFDSTLTPCDRPSHSLTPLVNCSIARAEVINGAKNNAEFIVWRILWLLDRIVEADPAMAETLWRDGWDPVDGHVIDAHELQNWFGDYDPERAEDLRGAFQALWDRWLGPGANGTYDNSAGVSVNSGFECYVNPEWWQFGLWLKYILTFNPCLYGGGSAHHLYASGPQFCGQFFANGNSDRENAGSMIHELLHRVRIDGVLIKDTHFGACDYDDGDDGLPKCYSPEEVLNLAENFPATAILNNENYEDYAIRYLDHWLTGGCTDTDVCAEVNDAHPNCEPPPPPPPPPEYVDCPDPSLEAFWGTPGCPCLDVNIFEFDDIELDGAPDGDGSYVTHGAGGPGQFCFGTNVVCGALPGPDPNSSADDHSICKSCGDNAEDTRVGCSCQTDFDCQGFEPGLVCWGSEESGWAPSAGGKCLPEGVAPNEDWHEEHPWFCLDNCESMALGVDGFGCYYDQDPGGLGLADHGECITVGNSCGPEYEIAGQCELNANKQCVETVNGDQCVDECQSEQDCIERGFPEFYECDFGAFQEGHCVPPGCANSNSNYCSLFR